MIVLIAGTTHTGKTVLAQRLLEKYKMPYLSIDHLKMGLIRSGQTALTPYDDKALTPYLWPILREIIKTAIENGQNLIIEGCYIPFDWKKDFDEKYLSDIKYCCLIMTAEYIEKHWTDIAKFENSIEKRMSDDIRKGDLMQDNAQNAALCQKNGLPYVLIDDVYNVDIDLALGVE